MASTRRKAAAAGLAVVGIAGLSLAAAATLTVNSDTLQAGSNLFVNCQTDPVRVQYTTAYQAGVYNVTSVSITGVASTCAGKNVRVTLLGASNASLGEVSGLAVAGSGTSLSALTAPVPASGVLGAAVVING